MERVMKKRFVHLGILSVLVMLVGCNSAFLNEGSTRVRVAMEPTPPNTQDFKAIYFMPTDKTVQDSRIEKDQHFSITLLSAHICDFREMRGLDIFTFDDSNKTKDDKNSGCTNGGVRPHSRTDRVTRGEITLIANVGESNNKRLTMNPADAKKNGRVIYYNDDIRESGQLINALNLPIYGPKKYTGKNFIFELWMMELDKNENQRMKSLLSSLAGMGAKAYPPSAAILSVLNNLGGALLSGKSDDIEARIQMRFDVSPPKNPASKVARLPLMEGYYAFVREENRDLNPKWSTFAINKDLGVLCKADASTYKCEEGDQTTYRERTWFLVRIARESKEAALDMEYGEQLSTFLNRIDQLQADENKIVKQELENLKEKLNKLMKVTDATTKPNTETKSTTKKQEEANVQGDQQN